jgi:hypothetical protein
MNKPDGKTAAESFSDFVNNYTADEEGFVNQLVNCTHRTLQQSAFKVMFMCIKAWSEKTEGQYDLRNEDTVKMSKKMVEAVKDEDYIRFI